ncbi:helix-turn-helix domain-containing protein [Stygiobacter electus]|jgi:DNA-binding transcriptional ArsR family regulator|uniref:Helix-turn-helix domain-containing protein n=1 Tax=Stygiobacter electus TaxID=3032292 RepID=A0AAE3P0C0_9BACT|nr:helix-turn-helix domain-containing protein [Stygiobacter electus]MDF1612059.1 helix-turn-helix domain-containing protein [Stygiobacter electus]
MGNNAVFSDLLNKIFADKLNVEILCSLYDKNLSVNDISSMLNLEIDELERHLEILVDYKILTKIQNESDVSYYLKEPKVCDSIIMLKDALYSLSIKSNL